MNNCEDAFLRVFDKNNYNENGGQLLKISANKKDGYFFEYLLFLPNKMKKNTNLILEMANYVTNRNFETEKEAVDFLYENFKSFKNPLHKFNSKTNFAILYPLIPRKNDGEEIFTNQLSSNSLFCKNKKYKRIDLQIIKMINNAKKDYY